MPKLISVDDFLGVSQPAEIEAPKPKELSVDEFLGLYQFSKQPRPSQDELRSQLKAAQAEPEATAAELYPEEVGRAKSRVFEGAVVQPISGALKASGALQEAVARQAGINAKSPYTSLGEEITKQGKRLPGTEDEDFWSNVQRGLGQVGGMVATGGILGAAGLPARIIPYIGVGLMSGSEFDDAYQSSKKRGDDPDLAVAKALGYASVAAMIENWAGAGRILRKIFKTKEAAAKTLSVMGVSKEIAKNVLSGYGEEGAQELAKGLIVEGKPDWEAVKQSAEIGALVQGPVSTAAMGNERWVSPKPEATPAYPGLPDELQGLPEPSVTLRKRGTGKPRISLKKEQPTPPVVAQAQPTVEQAAPQPATPPVAQAQPEAEAQVLTPNPDWRVTVQAPQPLDETTTVPGYVQIDEVIGTDNKWSKGPDKLRAQGYEIPDFSKLPSGKYTFAQAQKLLAEPQPTPPAEKALTEAKPVAITPGVTTETAQTTLPGVPPIVAEMLSTAQVAASAITQRISNVKPAPYVEGQKFETITFELDGKLYRAELKGRNKNLLPGMSPEADKGIASRALLDGDAKEIGNAPTQPPSPTSVSEPAVQSSTPAQKGSGVEPSPTQRQDKAGRAGEKPALEKQPWEMTRAEVQNGEWDVLNKETGEKFSKPGEHMLNLEVAHRAAIRQALREGKPVPSEVLADYPDLSPQPPVSPASKTEAVSKPTTPERAGASTTKTPETAPLPTPVFSSQVGVQQLQDRIGQLHSMLIDSDAFANSEFYDRSFPIPQTGGIVSARQNPRYQADAAWASKVDAAIKDITDTMVAANKQRMALLGKPRSGAFGVDYSIEKARAGYTVNVVRAWHNEAKQKYPYTSYLGNISIREAFQNSLDAVMAALQSRQIKRGEIKIDTQTHSERGFIVDDNGIGMSDQDIGSKFLSLHSTGKAVEGRFGGFGIAKAVILGPADTGTWTLHTRDNKFTHELATQNEVVQTAPMRQGTRIEVANDSERIISSTAKQYIETTELPKNVTVEYNGEQLANPFKGKKPTSDTVKVNDTTSYELLYYKKPPSDYDGQYIIRLVDKKTGAKLTQAIRNAGSDGFHGTVFVDITTQAVPGTNDYPLVDSRMEMKWDAEKPVRRLIEKHTIDPLSADRGVSSVRVQVMTRQEWQGTLQKIKTDPGYKTLMDAINKVWSETGQFFGTASVPVTPLADLEIKTDVGFKGYRGGSMFQAMHLAAYEAVARLMASPAGAQMTQFYGLLSKPINGGSVTAEHAAGGVMGLNFLAIDKTALKSPYTYALYLRDLIAHELTHDFYGPHNEQFTSKEIEVQRQTAHLFPEILKIAEAALGKQVTTKIVEKRVEVPVTVEVPIDKIVEKYLTPEQLQFIYDNYEQSPTGQTKDDLYYPTGPADASQLGLDWSGSSQRATGFSSTPENAGARGGLEQQSPPSPSGTQPGSVVAGGVNVPQVTPETRASEIKSTLDNWAKKIEEHRKNVNRAGSNASFLIGIDIILYKAGLAVAQKVLENASVQGSVIAISGAFDAAVKAAMDAINSMLAGQLRLRPSLVYKAEEMEAAIREGLKQTQLEAIPPPIPPVIADVIQEQEDQINNAGQTVAALQAEEESARPEGEKAMEDAEKTGDTIFGDRAKPTSVMGVQDASIREDLSAERRQRGVEFAKKVFDETGVRTVWDEESGLWTLDPSWVGSDEAGRALRDRIEEEVRRTRSRNYSGEQGDFLGNLLNSTRVAMTGASVTQFSPEVKNELYAIAQGEASFRGLLLAALRAMDHSISYMSRNVETALYKIRFDALGGEQITSAMREAMEFFKREVLGENGNQTVFTDAELDELIKKMPKLQAEFERLLNEKRGEHGSRLYRAVQSLYTKKRRKKLAALEADAELQEAIAAVVEDLKKRGIVPVVQTPSKLTPLKELLHMVDTTKDPTAQQAINDAINNAIGEAEINAGIDATLAAIETDPQFTTDEERLVAATAMREQFESGELLPEKEMVEAGLNLPKYRHWKNLRDNLTEYSPITVKLARRVITGDFKGTKFASETPKAAETRTLDFNKLAISPEAEVRRVLDNWMAELDSKMDLVSATPETRQGVMDVLKKEISDQYEQAKLRARENYFSAPKTSKPSPQDKLAQAINAGLFGDQRLNLDNPETREAFIANVASKAAVRKLTPSLRSMIQNVLNTPYYKRTDLAEEFAALIVRNTRMSHEQAVNASEVFLRAYNDKWAKAAQMAIVKARNALVGTQQKEERVRSKQGVWDKLVKAANSGYLDVGEVLRSEAKVRGWWEPSDQQIADVRELAIKLQRLSELTPKNKAEIEAAVEAARAEGMSDVKVSKLRETLTKTKLSNVGYGVADQRTIIKKKMELFWSKVSRPIGLKTTEGRSNLANFLLEYTAAGFLTTPGFVVRQGFDIITQGLMHSPTRAFGMALEQRRKDLEAGDATSFWKDALDNVRASFKARNASLKDRLSSVAYTLKTGTNDLRNVERILSGIATFERVEEKVDELNKQGRHELALMLYVASMNKFSYRFAAAMDNLHGIPAEYQEIRLLTESKLRERGMSVEEARSKADWVMGDNKRDWMIAMQEASDILSERPRLDGKPHSEADLRSTAGHIVRGMKYQRIGELGLDATDFQERLRLLRNTLGWNERVEGGFGGMVAKGVANIRRGFASMGIPVPSANFGNAIGIGINKVLTWSTPFASTNWGQETLFGVDPKAIQEGGESLTGDPFYRTPEDRAQRKIESIVGSTAGGIVFTLAAIGLIAVRNKWPKDKEERDEWERLGLRPGTFDIPVGDGKVLTMSMTTGPFMVVRPWLAAGGAIQDLLRDRSKAQARLDLEAARKGLPPGKINPIEFTDLIGVAMQTAWAAVGGGRTASGMVGSMTDFGQFDIKKAVAGQLVPFVPFLPGLRDIARLTGNRADSRFASFTDMLLPLPTSGAAQVNFLGDPVGSGNALARISAQLSGGNVPWPRNVKDDEQSHPYKIVFGTEYRPPTINTAMGRNINGEYRPLTTQELAKYTKLRGQYFKAELNTLPVNATAGQAKTAYLRANDRALTEIGVTPYSAGFGGTVRIPTTKAGKASRIGSGASLLPRRKTTAFKRYATRGTSRRPRLSLGVRKPRLTSLRSSGIRKLALRRPRLRLYA